MAISYDLKQRRSLFRSTFNTLAILSDGKKSTYAKFSSKHNSLFEENIVSPYAILTVYEVHRVAAGSKTIFVDTMSLDRSLQIGVKIGNPSPI